MTEKNDERDYYSHLVGIMLITRGVRFSVAESELRKEKFSIATISLLSVYLAGWSLAASLFPELVSSLQVRALSLVSVAASVSLLVISLFDYAAGRSVYAEKMLQNAFSITETLRESERELAKEFPNFIRLSQLAAQYEASVNRVGVNHSSKEYKLWKLQKVRPSSRCHAIEIWFTCTFLRALSFVSAMFFQIFLVIFIFSATIGIMVCL